MLPNESLYVILRFADYKTLVLAKLAAAHFLRLVTKFAEELACRHRFRVSFFTTDLTAYVRYEDLTIDADRSIEYEPGSLPSLAAVCKEVAGIIGPYAVAELNFYGDSWDLPGVDVVFEAAPPLKHAEAVTLYSPDDSITDGNYDAFMHNFAGMKSLDLSFNKNAFCQISWTFLRREYARHLRLLRVDVMDLTSPKDVLRSAEELVRECATLPRLLGGEVLELDLSRNYFPRAFALRIIELLKDSRRQVTFRVSTLRTREARTRGDLILDERDYTIDVDGSTTRYTSKECGLVVEVDGRRVTIRSTAEIPTINQSRRNE